MLSKTSLTVNAWYDMATDSKIIGELQTGQAVTNSQLKALVKQVDNIDAKLDNMNNVSQSSFDAYKTTVKEDYAPKSDVTFLKNTIYGLIVANIGQFVAYYFDLFGKK